MHNLTGIRVIFSVSDPWEFEDENGGPEIAGVIEAANSSSVLFHADAPFVVDQASYDWILCVCRHEGRGVEELTKGERTSYNGIGIPNDRLDEARMLDAKWWRG